MSDTSKFIESHEFNVLKKVSFNSRMEKVSTTLATKKR